MSTPADGTNGIIDWDSPKTWPVLGLMPGLLARTLVVRKHVQYIDEERQTREDVQNQA